MGGCRIEVKCVCACVCVSLSGWGCCFPSVRSTLHLPRPLSDRPTYITTPNTSVSLSSPFSSSLFPHSLPPSIHLSLPPSLSPAPISHECWCLSQLPTSLSFSLFHLLAAPSPHTKTSRQASLSIIYINDASSLPLPYIIYHPAALP